MSVSSVQSAIREFLASSKAEVLCIRGNWGTGKTHNWKTIAKAQRSLNGGVALNSYAYVSLFGVNSITELKSQILQNTVTRAQIGDVPSMETTGNIISTAESATRKGFIGLLSGILGNRSEAVVSALGLLISKQIVCIDDLERKGEKLSSSDVLGYISHLKEERGCKVVILLNDEALKGTDKAQFSAYLEKVVDRNLLFAPAAEESAAIAIPQSDDIAKIVRERCVQLGIDNIRVISKIHAAVQQIMPLLSAFSNETRESIAAAMVIMGWVHHQPSSAPSIEFLKGFSSRMWGRNEEKLTKEEEARDALLSNFGFSHLDELDLELYRGIANGYFTQEAIDAHASEFHRKVLKDQATERHRQAWHAYHYSFKNGMEVVEGIADSFIQEAEFLSAENMNGAVSLLRELAMFHKIAPVIDAFIATHKDDPEAMDPDRMYHHNEVADAEVVERLNAAREQQRPKQPIEDILSDKTDLYDQQVVTELLTFPAEDYERILREHEGEKLGAILRGLHAYSRIGNPSEDMKEITRRYHAAMRKVAADSDLNRHRVVRRGIKLEEPEAAEIATPAQST
ncbi:hypothetical protein [Rhizobium leguminosarum]|jgi:hypothetical protein|uniref:hypothetical protein n=1 Tax=Rhizobium leguminosarum TaxID=384 RepID=UPI00103203CA|nr:hypothetical protein [Rhizobium leguminosarum]TAV72615.1 hypothetical protein ELI28_03355 [Rhizobium leguminosarum]TAV77216.1 hypothetical protein ELI27_03355 [Rhizobium leguminosarum]TAZ28963.1 hypothetical protein ELH73_03360 [Rhizobium leguminosarum]